MLRFPSRTLTRPAVARACVSPVLLTSSRHFTDKILIGCSSSLISSGTILGLFHLLVTPVSPTIAVSTLAASAATGATCVIDGGSQGGSGFGAVAGVLIGAMGGYYAKSQKEPWRK